MIENPFDELSVIIEFGLQSFFIPVHIRTGTFQYSTGSKFNPGTLFFPVNKNSLSCEHPLRIMDGDLFKIRIVFESLPYRGSWNSGLEGIGSHACILPVGSWVETS